MGTALLVVLLIFFGTFMCTMEEIHESAKEKALGLLATIGVIMVISIIF